MKTETEKLSAMDYQFALDSQTACNLSGIVHSLSRTVKLIWDEALANNLGTDYVNTHPICRLYAEQISFLSGGGCCFDSETYSVAYRLCAERAGGENV